MKRKRKTATEIGARKMGSNTASAREMSMAASTINPSEKASQRVVNKAVRATFDPNTTQSGHKLAKNLIRRNPTKAVNALKSISKKKSNRRG